MGKITVLIPSIGRESCKAVKKAAQEAGDVRVLNTGLELVENLNRGVAKTDSEIIVFLSERGEPKSGWVSALYDAFSQIDNYGCVSFHSNIVQSGAITRTFLPYLGGYFFWPEYIHYHADQELGERARKNNHYVEMLDWIIEHPKPPQDEEKRLQIALHDKDIYERRCNSGFPNDFGDNVHGSP